MTLAPFARWLASSAAGRPRTARWFGTGLFAAALSVAEPAAAAPEAPGSDRGREPEGAPALPSGFWEHLDATKLETGVFFGSLTYAGIRDWKWGTAYFRFNSEDWLGLDTGSGGQDKLGHAFGTYALTEAMYLALRGQYDGRAPVTLYPPLFSWILMVYVEVFDGFSVDHGFAYEDLVMNTLGASASYLKNAFPTVGRSIDFRIDYHPSSSSGGKHPLLDYEGQKFLIALRPSGSDVFRDSPARFFELYLGAYARGFGKHPTQPDKQQTLFAGIGVDLATVLEGPRQRPGQYPGWSRDGLSTLVRVIQLPYGYPTVDLATRHRAR